MHTVCILRIDNFTQTQHNTQHDTERKLIASTDLSVDLQQSKSIYPCDMEQ